MRSLLKLGFLISVILMFGTKMNGQTIKKDRYGTVKVSIDLDTDVNFNFIDGTLAKMTEELDKHCISRFLKINVSPECSPKVLDDFRLSLFKELDDAGISRYDVHFIYEDINKYEYKEIKNHVLISWVCVMQ